MELNEIKERLEQHQYPATTEEIIAAHGDVRIDLAGGSERLEEVLSRFGEETFDRPEEVYETIQTGVCHYGVGRRFYSDRDPATIGGTGPTPISF
ncbi:DUF2795 domain-containing protein [Halopenitus sp. H-Gu1]|uniref:DUF5789 family protein n=1 Tax=Halopenitus sp. H-Gu1 TaxID=3242697 RepID=UPI00359DA665